MTINEIRIEPHIVKPDITQEYHAPKDGFVLWKIWIDNELLTETARPFKATDSIMELKTYIQIPVWLDGAWYVSVRRLDDYVIWYSNLEFNSIYYKPWNKRDAIFYFSVNHYDDICENANLKSDSLNLKLPTFGEKPRLNNQKPQPYEIRFLLLLNYPDTCNAIYREPYNSLDTTGKNILQKIEYALKEVSELTICEPPEEIIELRIGLDESEFTEAIWHIGRIDGKFAICFEQHPYFPVWLQSPAFDKVLSQEPFNQDI